LTTSYHIIMSFMSKLFVSHSNKPFLALQHRCIASRTTPLLLPSLDDFRDSESREKRMQEPVGRSWSVKELRRKSFDDLHKLWHVLYKERNMLYTEHHLSRRNSILMPQPERMQKVKKSMGAVKHVLGERKRDKLSQVALSRAIAEEQDKGMMTEGETGDDESANHDHNDDENRSK